MADAKKAFDRLEWPFFVLKSSFKFNLPVAIIDFVKLLYKYTTAKIYSNNVLSG